MLSCNIQDTIFVEEKTHPTSCNRIKAFYALAVSWFTLHRNYNHHNKLQRRFKSMFLVFSPNSKHLKT